MPECSDGNLYTNTLVSARFVSFKLLFGYCLSSQKLKIHDTFVQKFQQLNINRFHSSNFGNAIADFRESKYIVEALDMVRIMYEVNIHSAACQEEISKSRWWCRNVSNRVWIVFSPIKLGKIHPIWPAGIFPLVGWWSLHHLELVVAPMIPIETSIYGQFAEYSNSLPMNTCTPKTKKFPEKGYFNSRKGSSSAIV